MSTLALKIEAARRSRAWQLALDKFPFNLGNPTLPSLTGTDDRNKERSIKSERLHQARHAAAGAQALDWKVSAKSRMGFLNLLEKQHGPAFRRVPLVNSSRLLLHLGRASVLENVGIHADRTTGLPVIPGSAVKGAVSTWACWESHFEEADGSFRPFTETSVQRSRFVDPHQAFRILGDNAPSGSTAAGEIVFIGAWPEQPPVLGWDIVTPHHDPTGKSRDPVPNPFLCIEAGTTWHFALLAQPRGETRDYPGLLDTAQRWLTEGLEQSGIGAKTAAGYGRFMPPAAWIAATKSAGDLARMESETAKAREREENFEKLKESRIGDYTEVTFKGAVLNLLTQPQKAQLLQAEIERIRNNPANQPWIARLTEGLRGKEMRDHRKRLKEKTWFPQDWIPS